MSKKNLGEDIQLQIKTYEKKWISQWQRKQTYSVNPSSEKEKKYYILVMFPYPSGKIHMGHIRNYSLGDALARYKRLRGYQVLHPIGWDAFGLPAENAAIKNNIAPAEWTNSNINTMRSQLKSMGFSYDWQREIATCQKEYYHWNQYIFLQFLKKGWAYKKKAWVNWCQECTTVLANEQVVDGVCWRHPGVQVQKKMLSQWFFKITEFADQLLNDQEFIQEGWPKRVLVMQKHWIGKSRGTLVNFKISSKNNFTLSQGNYNSIQIFTTRLDTIFGASYVALAPEHWIFDDLPNSKYKEQINAFRKKVSSLSEIDRENPDLKEGLYAGFNVEHPFTREALPVYVANFVLPGYGTGAVMSVPAHDQRDFEFAKKYKLPIKAVISPLRKEPPPQKLSEAFTDEGFLFHSGEYNSLNSREAKNRMTEDLIKRDLGKEKIEYRLRDWLISRQRYWGTPIPIIYCPKCGVIPVPEEDLPVELPQDINFTEGVNPLTAHKNYLEVLCHQCGSTAQRETDTMDTFVDSSWYFIRYTSPKEKKFLLDQNATDHFMPVDQCIGGIEHANMHLLYARYFTKAFHVLGWVKTKEPFLRLLTQGMVLKNGKAMSKSLGNIVDPDELIQKYGADTIRVFSLFAAPPEKDLEWSDFAVEGSYRMIKRIFRFVESIRKALPSLHFNLQSPSFQENDPKQKALLCYIHRTIKDVTQDIERFSFNTAIARLMEILNYFYNQYFGLAKKSEKYAPVLSFSLSSFLVLLFPFAPFIALEMLERIGMKNEDELIWPAYSEEYLKQETFTLVIQINGKVRDRLEIEGSQTKEIIISIAQNREKIQSVLKGRVPKRYIYVPEKLINFVV